MFEIAHENAHELVFQSTFQWNGEHQREFQSIEGNHFFDSTNASKQPVVYPVKTTS